MCIYIYVCMYDVYYIYIYYKHFFVRIIMIIIMIKIHRIYTQTLQIPMTILGIRTIVQGTWRVQVCKSYTLECDYIYIYQPRVKCFLLQGIGDWSFICIFIQLRIEICVFLKLYRFQSLLRQDFLYVFCGLSFQEGVYMCTLYIQHELVKHTNK